MIAYWSERIGRIAAAWGIAAVCGVVIYVVLPYRAIAPQASVLVQRWTPGKGKPDALIDAFYNLVHATNEGLNRPCGGGKPCGTLATIDKAVTKAGDAVVTTQLEERATVPHVLAAMDSFKDSAARLGGTADAATSAIGTAQTSIAAIQPVLGALERDADAANKTVTDFDALVSSPDLSHALSHVEGMTASGDGILADAKKLADKETADWLKPHPWWQAPIAKGGQLIDITAAIARHTP